MMRISYEQSNPNAEKTVILGSSLGADRTMWREQVSGFSPSWNVVVFDLPGHGLSPISEVPSIDSFSDGVIAIADELGVQTFAYCGLSIGGVIGQNLGARYPARLNALVLASTGLTILNHDALIARAARVRAEGTDWIADVSAQRWFTRRFRESRPDVVSGMMGHLREMQPAGYADACVALAGFDGHQGAPTISVPTLVLYGDSDEATPPAGNAELASLIPDARIQMIPDASHLCNVERPALFTKLAEAHLAAYV